MTLRTFTFEHEVVPEEGELRFEVHVEVIIGHDRVSGERWVDDVHFVGANAQHGLDEAHVRLLVFKDEAIWEQLTEWALKGEPE